MVKGDIAVRKLIYVTPHYITWETIKGLEKFHKLSQHQEHLYNCKLNTLKHTDKCVFFSGAREKYGYTTLLNISCVLCSSIIALYLPIDIGTLNLIHAAISEKSELTDGRRTPV